MKTGILISLLAIAAISPSFAASFDESFADSTLRIDYIFGGGPCGKVVLLDSQTKTPGWFGKRHRLSELPLEGNGSITVRDVATGDTIYRQSFSSLFQEWIYTEEADSLNRSFENSFLVPLPRREADVILTLLDNRHLPMASSIWRYTPSDELVRVPRRVSPCHAEYVHRGGDPKDVIDVAIVAEGYTPEQQSVFLEDAARMTAEILRYEPFNSRRDRFNFIAVMTPSADSAVAVPLEGKWPETAFGSHYSTFRSPRYLTAPRVKAIHESLSGLPYEHIVILANTDTYGGGGIYNSYLLSAAHNSEALPVTVHEFGHSFGGLADEYFYAEEESDTYPLDIEPWEPNITTLKDFGSKWKAMVKPSTPVPTPWKEQQGGSRAEKKKRMAERKDYDFTVGAYEGGGYRSKGIYRPVETCRMRDNYVPVFCPVCEAALTRLIDFYTLP